MKLDHAGKRSLPLVKPDPDVENHCLDKGLLHTPCSRWRFMQNNSVLSHWDKPWVLLEKHLQHGRWRHLIYPKYPWPSQQLAETSLTSVLQFWLNYSLCIRSATGRGDKDALQLSPCHGGPVSRTKNESKHLQTNSLCWKGKVVFTHFFPSQTSRMWHSKRRSCFSAFYC